MFCPRMSMGVACSASRMEAWPGRWLWIVAPFIQQSHWLFPPLETEELRLHWKELFFFYPLPPLSTAIYMYFKSRLLLWTKIELDVWLYLMSHLFGCLFCCRSIVILTCQQATCWGRSEPERVRNMATSSPLISRKGRLCQCRSPSNYCKRCDTNNIFKLHTQTRQNAVCHQVVGKCWINITNALKWVRYEYEP